MTKLRFEGIQGLVSDELRRNPSSAELSIYVPLRTEDGPVPPYTPWNPAVELRRVAQWNGSDPAIFEVLLPDRVLGSARVEVSSLVLCPNSNAVRVVLARAEQVVVNRTPTELREQELVFTLLASTQTQPNCP